MATQTNKSQAKSKQQNPDVPEFLRDAAASGDIGGFEDLNQSTMAIPFIRIAQPQSPAVNKQKSEYIEGLEPGEFYNTVTRENLGNGFSCVCLKFEHIYLEWEPDRGPLVAYHDEENARRIAADTTFGAWRTAEGNFLQENYVYYLLIAGREAEGVVIFSAASTQIKQARAFNRVMSSHVLPTGQRAKPYLLVFEFSSEYKENDKGGWYVFKPELRGYIDELQFESVKRERIALPEKRVDYQQLEDQSTGDASDPEGEF